MGRKPKRRKTVERSDGYHYSPLSEEAGEIRLLTLHPGNFKDEIHLCLENVPFTQSSRPQFEALFYAWGSTKSRSKIFIGLGLPHLSVTRSVVGALKHLRYPDRERVLWIDAICVNQQDLDERTAQVQRMADIYSRASKVIVWLGPSSHNSKLALSTLELIGSNITADWKLYTMKPKGLAKEHWADPQQPLPLDAPQVQAINDLINRSWFGRLWVWQEIYLGSRDSQVMCGSDTVLWQTFRSSVFALNRKRSPQTKPSLDGHRVYNVFDICRLEGDSGYDSFEDLLDWTRFSQCSDPRDRVFAIYSLLSDDSRRRIPKPDYTKTVSEVFTTTCIQYIEKSRRLRLLSHREMRHNSDWPSWVPDWSIRRAWQPFRECNDAAPDSNFTGFVDGEVAFATGVEIGIVEHVEPGVVNPWDTNEELSAFLHRLANHWGNPASDSDGAMTLESLSCVAIAGDFADRYDPQSTARPTQSQAHEVIGMLINRTWEGNVSHYSLDIVRDNILYYLKGRSVFKSKTGFAGLAPKTTRAGDIVTVLLGADNTTVLRPGGNGQYKAVGGAYSHGFMDGEALLGQLPDSFKKILKTSEKSGSDYGVFLNQETGLQQTEDPRKGPLPPNWRVEPDDEDPLITWYVDGETGEVTEFDPRMSAEALRERGVDLKVFEII